VARPRFRLAEVARVHWLAFPSPPTARPIDLAGIKAPAGLPALLAIIAIVALSLVTAMYARLYLMRRQAD
jgi:hypothetical protein